jgi:diguanylate cyclase (GGDEF)-like protein
VIESSFVRPKSRKPYALIAEADPSRAAEYVTLVSSMGLEPNHVRDGEAGRIALRTRGAPALVVCELALPRADGFALLAELRQRCSPEQTPVVVISAYLELRKRAWDQREPLGIAAVLPTSSTRQAIHQALKQALVPAAPQPSRPPPQPRAPQVRLESLDTSGFVGDDERVAALAESIADAFEAPLVLLDTAGGTFFAGALAENLRVDSPEAAALIKLTQVKRPSLILDLLIDPSRMDNVAARAGLVRSTVLAPIVSPSGETLGALALFHQQRAAFATAQLDAVVAVTRRLAGEAAMRAVDDHSVEIMISRSEPATLPQLVALLDHIGSGVVLFDEPRRVVFANQAAGQLLSIAPEQLLGLTFDEFVERNALLFEDPADYVRRARPPAAGPFAVREEFERRDPKGVLRWVVKPVPFQSGAGEVCLLTDVTAEVELARAREALVRTDGLTGLPNRIAAEETLAREIARARRESLPLALARFDLDGFSELNRAHGAATGDTVLQRIGLMLEATVRGGDFVARWDGDEFLLLFWGVTGDGARIAAERVCREAADLDFGAAGRVTASVGVVCIDLERPPESALEAAGADLGKARVAGGNRVQSGAT